MNELFETQAEQLPFPITWEIEPCNQTVGGLHVATDGTLWVSHARSEHDLPEGVFLTYDTFAPNGHWLQEVHIACPLEIIPAGKNVGRVVQRRSCIVDGEE